MIIDEWLLMVSKRLTGRWLLQLIGDIFGGGLNPHVFPCESMWKRSGINGLV